MDPFGSSPSQPQSVLSSLMGCGPGSVINGGQTPASLSGFSLGSGSIFGGQTPASTSGGASHSLNGPGSVFGPNSVLGSSLFFHNPLLNGVGPASILGGPS